MALLFHFRLIFSVECLPPSSASFGAVHSLTSFFEAILTLLPLSALGVVLFNPGRLVTVFHLRRLSVLSFLPDLSPHHFDSALNLQSALSFVFVFPLCPAAYLLFESSFFSISPSIRDVLTIPSRHRPPPPDSRASS